MKNPDLPTENWENTLYPKTEYSSVAIQFEEKKMPTETENQGTNKLEKIEGRKKEVYVGIAILAIFFAETLIYFGRLKEALWIHMVILIGLSLSIALIKNEDVYKTYQALMLIPLIRLFYFSMPVFSDTLYFLTFIYAILAVPVMIIISYQQLTRENLGITFRRIWLYLPLSVLISFGLAMGGYTNIQTGSLIPNLSPLNLLKITVIMVFFLGLVEEIIFRSFLQTRFNMIFGVWGGILLSGILFGITHSSYGTSPDVLYMSFVGTVIGYVFYKTRSLPLITLIHGFIYVFLLGILPHLRSSIWIF
jgi:membrane protease YdiL (CAAX protease family)